MKTLLVGSILIATVLAQGCMQRDYGNSDTTNITGPGVGQGYWTKVTEAIPPTERKTFSDMNPGYVLDASAYGRTAVNADNSTGWKAEKYKMVIQDTAGMEVASTEFTVKLLERSEWRGWGTFVDDKLVGLVGRNLCRDSEIGKEYTVTATKETVQMVGCTIPVRNGPTVGKRVVVFK